jgi:hypothetical protein
MTRVALAVEAGKGNDASIFNQKDQNVRKASDKRSAPALMDCGEAMRKLCDDAKAVFDRLDKSPR